MDLLDLEAQLVDTSALLATMDDDSIASATRNGLPDTSAIIHWTDDVFNALVRHRSEEEWQTVLGDIVDGLQSLLRSPMAFKSIDRINIIAEILLEFPRLRKAVAKDTSAAYEGDPAAQDCSEIVLSYPSIRAVTIQRVAHVLHRLQVPQLPRIMTEYAHQTTGIDIHPGAKIGHSFFIDHGTGVVIGETTTIGDHVKLYQGVTLGALSFRRDKEGKILRGQKRHPTIEDEVTIYAEATILGGDTVIGKGSIIGGNVWLTQSVLPGSKVVVEPTLKHNE